MFSSFLGSGGAGSSGSTAASSGSTSLFGSGGLFGGSSSGSLFASSASSGGLFSSPASSGGLFASSASSGGLFSQAAASSGGFFGASSAGGEAEQAQEEEYVVEEEVTTVPGWTPSVTLEVQESVTLGEENEEELYSQRSKLYRFRDGEWKERGLGEAKLLKHTETGKVRFILRQEKTLKIVANHYVVDVAPYCELRPNAGSEKCWVWTAQDCADEEMVVEQFALKFGNADLANAFKDAFDKAKDMNRKIFDDPASSTATQDIASSKEPISAKEGYPKQPVSEASAVSGGGLSGKASGGSLFSAGSATGGLFSTPAASASTGGLFSSSSQGGLFSGASSSSLFGSTGISSGGLFAAAAEGSKAPASSKEDQPKAADADDDCYVVEEEVTTVPGWTPSVSLEVKDSIDLGEEDEEELFSQRSKLYRFRDGEWKERGLGDSKLLKHKRTGKVRFILRQEKTLKIVANHYVIDFAPYCELRPNAGNEKCWNWVAQDSSEEELVIEQFALKFGTPELATQFKETFNNAKELNRTAIDLNGSEEAVRESMPVTDTSSGGAASSSSSLFAASTASGSGGLASQTSGGLFASGTATGGLFSTPAASSSGGLFASGAAGTGGLFSTLAASSGGSLFSTSDTAAATGGLFSTPAASSGGGTGGLFSTFAASSGGSFFSTPATGGLFSTPVASSGGGASGGNVAEGADDDCYVVEEEVTSIPGWAPSVTLDVCGDIATGEENEDQVYCQRSKLYRFRDGEWKERGLGEAKLLKNPKTGMTRFLLRQEKTMKIMANHVVIDQDPYCNLRLNSGNEKCWVWTAIDYAEDESQTEQFALKFGNKELADAFKEAFDKAKTTPNADSSSTTATAKTDPPASPAKSEDTKQNVVPSPPRATSGGLFSNPSTSKDGGSIFASPATGGLFASPAGSSGGGLFSLGQAATGGLFSQPATGSIGLFGGSSGSSLFGGPPASGGLFSTPASSGSLLGGATAAASPSGGAAAEQPQEDEYVVEEEVTTVPGWAPSVTLEVQDHVALGEEDEDELYTQRSKLYRFRDGEWKERGLGEAKLLKHKETGKVRFILRQEKTLKIVANHYAVDVAPYCDLRPNAGSEKCWVWTAQDYAEEEMVVEQFALKFASAELATAFKEAFDNAKDLNRNAIDVPASGGGAKESTAAAPATDKDKKQPPSDAKATSGVGVSQPSSGGLFAGGSASGGLFSAPAASASTGGLFSSASQGGLFSVATSGGLFGCASGSSGGGLFSGASSGGLFGSASGSSGGMAASASAQDNDAKGKAEDDDDGYVAEEEVTTVPGWTPSVSLEVKDHIDLGEEDEEELYSQRSKLYRFRDGEWKERGLGDSKLLKHKQTGKVRFMLRQEKTLKIVANHYVIDYAPYCDLRPNAGSDKCWIWVAQDSSEDELVIEQFALKFGTPELALKFKEAFNNAKELNRKAIVDLPGSEADTSQVSKQPPQSTGAIGTSSGASSSGGSSASSGGLFNAPAASSGGGLFSVASTGGMFSAPAASSGGGLFSTPASTGGGLFGPPSTGGLFSAPAASSGGGLFGAPSTGGLFSSPAASSGGGLFSAPSTGGLFSAPASSGSSSSAATGGLFSSTFAASSGGGLFSTKSTGGGLFATPSAMTSSSGGLFSASSSAPAAGPSGGNAPETADEDNYVVEEEIVSIPGWTPSVTLDIRNDVTTGEENEEQVYCQRSKLYRFKDGEWKERGTGEAKLLKDPKTGRTRLLLRQEKTMKIVANHFVIDQDPYCCLQPNSGNEKCWVWTVPDSADEETQVEQFALRFGSVELAAAFKEAFDKAKTKPDATSKASSTGATSKAGSTAAPVAVAKAESAQQQDAEEDEEEEDEEEDYDYGDYADEIENETGGAATAGGFAALAAKQNEGGWRCSACCLRWPDEAVECAVCEIPRPGYEAVAEKSAEEKQKAAQSAAALFTGNTAATSSAPQGTGFSFASPAGAAAPQSTGGFSFTPSAGAATTGGFNFASPAGATTSSASLFGGSATTSGSSSGSMFPAGHTPVVVPPPAKASGGGLFAGASTGAGLFGASSSGGGIFASPATGGLFASSAASSGSGLFGSGQAMTGGMFGQPTSSGTTGIFGASSGSSPVGGSSTGIGLFNAPASSGGLFGGAAPTTSPISGLFSGQSSSGSDVGLASTGLVAKSASPSFASPIQAAPPPPPPPPAPVTPAIDTPQVSASLTPSGTGAWKDSVPDSMTEDTQAIRKEMKRLEQQIKELTEACDRSEARAKKAEDRARAMEDRGDRNDEALRGTVDQVRREVTSRLGDLQKKVYEDGATIQSLQAEQAQTSQVASRLKEGLRKETEARQALESSARATADTAEHALKVAEEARQEIQDVVKERLEALEAKVSRKGIEALKKLSVPDRIMYFRQKSSKMLTDESNDQKSILHETGSGGRGPLLRSVTMPATEAGSRGRGPVLRSVTMPVTSPSP